MEDINKENLEKAINSGSQDSQNSQQQNQQPSSQNSQDQQQIQNQGQNQPKQEMSREMEIGFHQGAINTLNKERSELIKMAQNVDSIMQAHAQRLQELGVDLKFQKNSDNSQNTKSD